MRLFAALPLPETAVERLLSMRLKLNRPNDGLRWSTPEQWHITLQFYGEVSQEGLQRLTSALESLNAPAPRIVLEALDWFPAKGILFAAVEPAEALMCFQADLQAASERCGFVANSRAFHPHITLARSRGKVGHRTLQRLAVPELPSIGAPLQWTAKQCMLIQSSLLPSGAHYEVLASIALDASQDRLTA